MPSKYQEINYKLRYTNINRQIHIINIQTHKYNRLEHIQTDRQAQVNRGHLHDLQTGITWPKECRLIGQDHWNMLTSVTAIRQAERSNEVMTTFSFFNLINLSSVTKSWGNTWKDHTMSYNIQNYIKFKIWKENWVFLHKNLSLHPSLDHASLRVLK